MSGARHVLPPSLQCGVSLVELLLTLAIGALVMLPLLNLLNTTAAASAHVKPRYELEREAAFALQRIVSQVRDGMPVANYTLDGDKLVETSGATVSTLAGSVTAFSLATPAAATSKQLVHVSLTLARGGATATASSTVRVGEPR
jgi:prepilin-type N-terminal cleavage/methylation domain-containing protein